MKLLTVSLTLLLSLNACAHQSEKANHHAVAEDKTQSFFSGDISLEQLRSDKAFFQHADHEKISAESIALIRTIQQPVEITSYFGLWCHDSKREIPRLLDLLEQAANPNIEHKLIALTIEKKEPLNRQEADKVLFTPTIIIKKDGQEIGRIIEKPEQNLAEDIVRIISENF